MISALNKKQVSSIEVTQYYLERCQKLDPQLNSFITLDVDRALAAARSSDARRAQGAAGLLEGVPLAHKDIFCAKDWRTTCGSKMLSNFISPYDAHLITQFAQEGAFILGKTNMDEFAMGSSNETSAFGPVKNPWNTTRVPGGSSGGSAAAVAAGLAPAATGTDTGGSIRQPAAFCGLTGLKPTYGLVSRFGMVAFASSLDQAGPIAVSAEDCALMLEVMCGFDERDSTSVNRPREKYFSRLKMPTSPRPLEGLRLGVPEEFFPATLAANVGKVVEQALKKMCELGAQIVSVRLPQVELSLPAYYVIAPAEASSNLSRFDGVRYGYRSPHARTLEELYSKSRSEGFGDEVKRRILTGTYVLSHGYYDAYYLQAQKIRQLVANNFADAFQKCDLIVGPTTPTSAFPLGFHPDNPVEMYLSDIFTIPANLAGMPAMSLPCGFDEQGLPVGLHIMGKAFDEGRMLEVAHRYQQATDWTLQRAKLP